MTNTILVFILLAILLKTWLDYRQNRQIKSYINALAEMLGDQLRELIETNKTKKGK